MKNEETLIQLLVSELIDRGNIEELVKLRNSMTTWLPKELLHHDDYLVVDAIDNYLDPKFHLEGESLINSIPEIS